MYSSVAAPPAMGGAGVKKVRTIAAMRIPTNNQADTPPNRYSRRHDETGPANRGAKPVPPLTNFAIEFHLFFCASGGRPFGLTLSTSTFLMWLGRSGSRLVDWSRCEPLTADTSRTPR